MKVDTDPSGLASGVTYLDSDGATQQLEAPLVILANYVQEIVRLLLLSTSMASRALAADDGFWADYRRRLEQTDGSSFDAWRNYFLALNHRASVLFSPGKRK